MKYQFSREDVEKRLIEVGAIQPCSRCGHEKFSVLRGLSTIYLNEEYDSDVVKFGSSAHVPVIYVSCTNCAAITMHGIGGLKLIDFHSGRDEG